ncbi:hypothetical protein BH11ARM2_BH11ARM2_02200 [soil metagenome]
MRRLLLAPLALVATASAQSWNEVARVRPEIAITVRQTASGTDSVEITPLNPDYPPGQLQDRAKEIAESLGEEPRGLLLQKLDFGSLAGRNPISASFGMDGLVNRQEGTVKLANLVRPFAAEGIKGMSIVCEGFKPTKATVLSYRSEGVQMLASPQSGGVGAEFRVLLSSTDPTKIDIPDRQEPKKQPYPKKEVQPGPDYVTYGIVAVAALALGALVYSLMLRPRSKPR